jgi:hypothetical protein
LIDLQAGHIQIEIVAVFDGISMSIKKRILPIPDGHVTLLGMAGQTSVKAIPKPGRPGEYSARKVVLLKPSRKSTGYVFRYFYVSSDQTKGRQPEKGQANGNQRHKLGALEAFPPRLTPWRKSGTVSNCISDTWMELSQKQEVKVMALSARRLEKTKYCFSTCAA